MQAAVERARARRKTYIPIAIDREDEDLGGDPGGPVRHDDEQPGQGVERPALKSAIRGVPLKMYWFQKGSCPWRSMEPTSTRSG